MPADADVVQLVTCSCPIKKLTRQRGNKSAPLMGPVKKLPRHLQGCVYCRLLPILFYPSAIFVLVKLQ